MNPLEDTVELTFTDATKLITCNLINNETAARAAFIVHYCIEDNWYHASFEHNGYLLQEGKQKVKSKRFLRKLDELLYEKNEGPKPWGHIAQKYDSLTVLLCPKITEGFKNNRRIIYATGKAAAEDIIKATKSYEFIRLYQEGATGTIRIKNATH